MQILLDAHNGARQSTVPPGSNLAALFWDFSIASDAADYAATCPRTTDFLDANVGWVVHQANNQFNPGEAFKQWQRIGSDYVYSSHTCITGSIQKCAPYLKIVDDAQRLVGCAVKTCQAALGTVDPNGVACGNPCSIDVYVCMYNKDANLGVQPYAPGAQCSACPGDRPFCSYANANGLSATGGLCTDTNGLLKVGQDPSDSVFFGRRSTAIMSYVGMGFGVIIAFALGYYGYKVRMWYNSGETKLSPRREEGSKYERVQLGEVASSNRTNALGTSAAPASGGRGPPPLPSGKPTVLPPNWQIHKDSQGRNYYYNTVTGASQWTLPV